MLHGTHYCPIPLSPYVTIDLKRLDLKKGHDFIVPFRVPKCPIFFFRTPTERAKSVILESIKEPLWGLVPKNPRP